MLGTDKMREVNMTVKGVWSKVNIHPTVFAGRKTTGSAGVIVGPLYFVHHARLGKITVLGPFFVTWEHCDID